jgi:hypothetical protein
MVTETFRREERAEESGATRAGRRMKKDSGSTARRTPTGVSGAGEAGAETDADAAAAAADAEPVRTAIAIPTSQGKEGESVPLSPLEFFTQHLDFFPDPKQIEVIQATSSRVLLNCTRQWGKSTLSAAVALHRAWFHPNSLIVIISPGARQSAELLRKVREFALRLLPARQLKRDPVNEVSLVLPNGSRIIGLPGASEGTIRGFSAVNLLLVDEAAQVADELYHAVRPMLVASRGDLWLMSTPFARRGFFYHEWTQGGPHWQRISVPATECPRFTPEILEEQRLSLGDHAFQREFLCQFGDDISTMFTDEVIQKAVTNRIKPLFDYPVLARLCNVEAQPHEPEPPPRPLPEIRISKTKPLDLKFLIPF